MSFSARRTTLTRRKAISDRGDYEFDSSTRSVSSRQTQDWLEEAKKMVASSPSRGGDSPSRLVSSPRFASSQGRLSTSSIDRRDPLSRSARRHRTVAGISGEILSKTAANHTRNRSESNLDPPQPDSEPSSLASETQKWISNNLKSTNSPDPNSEKNSPQGLVGLPRRFVKFNGGVGKEQMECLDRVLQDAMSLNQKVVIFSHVPIEHRATDSVALLWNYEEVMEVIRKYRCVKVCLAGHNHEDGYAVDSHGVHHRVLAAALECPPGTDAFGSVDVFKDSLLVYGTDRMGCQEMIFNC